MAANLPALFLALSTTLFSIASFSRIEQRSAEDAVLCLVLSTVAWALGAIAGYVFPFVREKETSRGRFIRGGATLLMAVALAIWPWVESFVGQGLCGSIVLFCSGLLIPAIVGMNLEDPADMREAYIRASFGAAVGAVVGAIFQCLEHSNFPGVSAAFYLAAIGSLISWVVEPSLYLDTARMKYRLAPLPLILIFLILIPFAPGRFSLQSQAEVAPFAVDAVFAFRPDRKFDTYVMGPDAAKHFEAIPEAVRTTSVRTVTISETNGRRLLTAEPRRFDLIQIYLPTENEGETAKRFDLRAEGAVTVEALRLYFDRLKDDGFLQITGEAWGSHAQALLATIAEAWKKSARRDVDLHAVGVVGQGKQVLKTVIVRMKPFQREERDVLGKILKVNDPQGEASLMLISDASGAVLNDDQPLVRAPISFNPTVLWLTIAFVLGLVGWISMQERRKELASRWQTASVATYFAGLGISFAFFQVFFVLRALRSWGAPLTSTSLVFAVVFFSQAAGAAFFAGQPGRRAGVRIQPLANFVFAVMFTYLGAVLFEPLVRSGAVWLSVFVGMSVLIPFGLLGGGFLPNALEEAVDKLPPRVQTLLWATYAAGTALGIYVATIAAFESGLDVVYIAGLFSFAWVAIFSGLIRPWNVRKRG